jgi:adenylate kinase
VRLVLLGPPGVGKGTQGRRLAASQGWALISTGEILRTAIAHQTPLGLEAQSIIDAGRLVSDDVMIGLVEERIAKADALAGFVLDGFPRTIPQAQALDAMLAQQEQRLNAALSLTADETELVHRLSARRECPVCKRAYNLVNAAPRDGRHCDDHPGMVLVQRADDAPETVAKRLVVYREQTAPLLEYYRRQGRLREVDGQGPMDDVEQRMNLVIAALQMDAGLEPV